MNQEKEIVNDFNASISHAHGIFDDYETYAHQRIDLLEQSLSGISKEEKENRIEELTLLLLSKNYDNLKSEANSWINNASKSSTVWNVFLLGNVDNIKDAIDKWTKDLNAVSMKYLLSEKSEVADFNVDCTAKIEAIQGLNNLKQKYSNREFKFNWLSGLTMLICFLMLLCPYFIQERNAANCERFWDFWPFSRFYNSNTDIESMPEPEYEPVVPQKKKTSSKGNPEDSNDYQETTKNIRKPKTSKGAPV